MAPKIKLTRRGELVVDTLAAIAGIAAVVFTVAALHLIGFGA